MAAEAIREAAMDFTPPRIVSTRLHPKLPIFRLDQGAETYLYAPGHAYRVTRDEADRLQAAFVSDKPLQPALTGLASTLTDQAWQAQRAWEKLAEAPFAPVCLTVYLSNRCTLGCSYCFAAPARSEGKSSAGRPRQGHDRDAALPVIRADIVEQAAQIVARHCARSGRPLTVVFHGGGEPTLHWELLQRLVALTRRVAALHGIDWWGYIATHGVLSESRVEWLARHFDLVGLSCDGPPAIQDAQRPTARGTGTAGIVARTARVLAQIGTPFVARATITPESVRHQAEIVRYLHETLGARAIRFEPVYRAGGHPGTGFVPEDAESFVEAFLAARRLATRLGCELGLSGARLDEIHGPYCNVLRDVLQLTPDGGASACFLSTNGRDAPGRATSLGQVTGRAGLVVDEDRVVELRRRALQIPVPCWGCVNIHHCVRECPEYCPALEEKDAFPVVAGFRCQVYRQLAERWICQQAFARGF